MRCRLHAAVTVLWPAITGVVFLAPVVPAQSAATAVDPRLRDAPANTWVKLAEEATGARDWPAFFFDPGQGKFVVSGGIAKKQAHPDTEQFDVAAGKWTHVVPSGQAGSGPSDAPGAEFRGNTVPLLADKAGTMRIVRGLNPYEWDPGLYNQWAFNPDDGKVYAYHFDATLVLEPKTGIWTNLLVPRFSQSHGFRLLYGALAYDPVNKEILSIGGTSDEDGGTPGTWAFHPATKEWKRIPQGSMELRELNAAAGALHTAMTTLLNACRNRFHITESENEARRDLVAGAGEVAAAAEKLTAKLAAAKLAGPAVNAPTAALAALKNVGPGWKALAGKLGGAITGTTLVEAQALLDAADRAERALDVEPCGRAAAPAVTCFGKDKIVLFSGCRLDGYLADTWVYDCKTRTWEQRWPKVCPAPRAGPVMAWLPKSGKVVLYGAIPFNSGYGSPHGNQSPPQDLWTYDVDANEWKLLAGPVKDAPLDACGAVAPNDTLIALSADPKNKHGRVTWGIRVDPGAADAGRDQAGVAPGTATVVFDTPADYDQAATPDAAGIGKLLKDMPANQWTPLPKPPKRPNSHPWGKTPYDTVRHQWLSFGGGHSVTHFNDVAHYSMRAATWSQGYGEEYPYQNASFCAFFNQTFRNRPTVPTHVWDGVAFDTVSGKAVFCVRGGTWIYDPDKRAWEYPPVWSNGGGSKVNMAGTPLGVVYWDAGGDLHLLNVQSRTWKKLPVKGGQLGAAYSDTGGICYDPKRDCLWLGHGGSMIRYDMKSSEAAMDAPSGKPVGVYMRGAAYIPELDMVLSAGRQTGAGGEVGNLAYDIQNKKWVGLVLPCGDGQPRVNDKDYSDINLSVAYDPGLKLAVFHSNQMEILAARIDLSGLKTFEVRMQVPKKK
jgi:hypothetical protein